MNINKAPDTPEITEDNWRIFARCIGEFPEIFYPDRYTEALVKPAKKYAVNAV